MRVVSRLEVADPATWDELAAVLDLDTLLEPGGGLARVARDDRTLCDALEAAGIGALVRYAHRTPAQVEAARDALDQQVAALRADVRRVLISAQRHALGGVVRANHAWDPEQDGETVRVLIGLGLLAPDVVDGAVAAGRFRLHPDLPEPPPVPYDFADALMDETDDLGDVGVAPIPLLSDLAAVAAALQRRPARRTHAGAVGKADARALGRQLADDDLRASGDLEGHPRWGRALAALQALGAVSLDPIKRELFVDVGLEGVLEGTAEDALDRFVHKVIDRDLHGVVPAVREALRQAGDGAVDAMIFGELLAAQHRDLLFPPWLREDRAIYPNPDGGRPRLYDDDGWERVEARMIGVVLRRLERLGLLRQAPGVFAATPDGRRWAGATTAPTPPLWVTSDLEVLVPPGALTPWERFQLERLSRCLARDTADRYRLDRDSLANWLSTHDLEEALDLLRRRAPVVPPGVEETLTEWARAATRVVLVRGLLVEDAGQA